MVLSQQKTFEQTIEAAHRFTLRRRLGAGGMGVVYEAYDRLRDDVVALKTLRRIDADALYLFKQEFRALADVTHPNLVTLYELLAVDDKWFFTMELLRGRTILSYLRSDPGDPAQEVILTSDATRSADPESLLPSITEPTLASPAPPTPQVIHPGVSAAALRPIVVQLAEALAALHGTGNLHCDIKPSNVMVTEEGRVVVLDYGVITATASDREPFTGSGLRGTPAYASPEQAAGRPPTEASDWYGVGVILYEALTGRRPFAGSSHDVLATKQVADPQHPTRYVPSADPRLAALCMKLLARDPTARPVGDEVVRALGTEMGGADDPPRLEIVAPTKADDLALVGRSRELARLREAFDESRNGRGTVVRVEGRSGTGKTTLVERFLDDIARGDQALILSGRCYERESVPHQAVDGLVDALCQYLLGLPREEADLLMPVDVLAMVRAFPVLGRVEAVAQARRRSKIADADPVGLRRRAHAALRELLARTAERRALVLFIDDLQWGDADSAPFLADLLRPPVPPLLLVVTYRSEDAASSVLLQSLLDRDQGALANATKLSIGPLSLSDAQGLAAALLESGGATPDAAGPIAREAGGNPFFVHELVRYILSGSRAWSAHVPTLADVLAARASQLSEDARRVLEVVAVAGKPIQAAVARRAARLRDNYQRAIAELRTAHLARTTGAEGSLILQTYHDRIRESVIRGFDPHELRDTHWRIAESLVAAGVRDPEALAWHYAGSEQLALACEQAEIAGDKASDALAFERAAAYFAQALDLAASDDDALRASLGRRLGESLVNAGRGRESPPVFLAAASHAEADDASDLRVRAGSELLRSGRVEDGVGVLRGPLATAGITLPRSKIWAATALLLRRTYARLRGVGFERRAPAQIPPRALTRIDACHAAAAGLAMVDPLRGAFVQIQHLLSALRHGDPFRVGRALTYEAGFLCIAGARIRPRVHNILRTVRAIADELDDPYLKALHHTHAALAEYQCCLWKDTLKHANDAERTYQRECTGSSWERSSVQLYGLWALYWLGELRELAERTRVSLRDARERGDVYATVCLKIGLPAVSGLVVDDPETTRRHVEEAAAQWPHRDYHLQHYWVAMALVHCDLYTGDPMAASARMEAQWPKLRRAFLLNVVMVRAETLHLRARCALAAAAVSDEPARFLRLATKLTKRLARQRMPWCKPAADLLRAGIACSRGDVDRAVLRLAEAETGLRLADTHALAFAAMYRRGELVGGEQGRELTQAAATWAREQAVANIDSMMGLFAPGFAVRRP